MSEVIEKLKKKIDQQTDRIRKLEGATNHAGGLKTAWKPASSAPKTHIILADVGYPWPQPCLWDAEAGKWATAFLNIENKNEAHEAQNVWWETEYEPEIKRWMDIPSLA